eukprot:CAMPEP_0179137626 /NCGR_PEP_ID=MMETSP0796-20121207/65665_1 /TAXON_ID=73915 /ORGANISM="Pyrodinium bahamense, Strain pbaha01" /LENGTH=377 /DNA_ID=CAMNT_0020836819 /DNA_START=183 /DNA_END=1313 /DNA_ORIENTATION=-
MGAGILTLSWAFAYSTMWPGVLCTVLMGLMSAHSFWMLGRCSDITGKRSYGGIWAFAFGERLAWVPSLVTFVFCAFSIVSYLIIIGDYLPLSLHGLDLPVVLHRRAAILLVALLILPLNLTDDVSFLGYASILGTIGSLYAASVLVVESVEGRGPPSDMQSWSLSLGMCVTAPAVTFAFNGHFNAPVLYQSLANHSPARWGVVTAIAYGACFLITCASGISGYYMFGSTLLLPGRSNVFTAPALQGKAEVMVAYLATSLSVALGIPFYMQSTRGALLELMQSRGIACGAPGKGTRSLSAVCVLATLCAAMLLTDLGIINAINGAVCACLIMFVFPSMMYLRCVRGLDACQGVFHCGLPIASMAIGLVVGVAGVVTSM